MRLTMGNKGNSSDCFQIILKDYVHFKDAEEKRLLVNPET